MDGNDYLTRLSWTSWTPGLASGYGTQVVNDYLPYCAAGHFDSYPVLGDYPGTVTDTLWT
jgi:hypothetical protein